MPAKQKKSKKTKSKKKSTPKKTVNAKVRKRKPAGASKKTTRETESLETLNTYIRPADGDVDIYIDEAAGEGCGDAGPDTHGSGEGEP